MLLLDRHGFIQSLVCLVPHLEMDLLRQMLSWVLGAPRGLLFSVGAGPCFSSLSLVLGDYVDYLVVMVGRFVG